LKNEGTGIDRGSVEETLILPLWARAIEAEKADPIIRDDYARKIVSKLSYDFSHIETRHMEQHQIVWPIRAYVFDETVRAFIESNSNSVVVNIGAGLDTTFQRIDNGRVVWINIDLPGVAALRHTLIPDSEREMTVPRSIFDFTWIDDIASQTEGRAIMFMAAGVLCYFAPSENELLFRTLADAFPSAHLVFDAMSWLTTWGTNRDLMKKSGYDPSALLKWHIKRASRLRRWVDAIKIIEEYPMFSRIPIKEDWGKRTIWGLHLSDFLRLYNLIHVQL
jgi:O-methyltransferase involved in polyketide biosynthesis